MAFDHEKLDVYRVALEFLAWVGELLDGPLKGCQPNAVKHLDKASQSIVNNIAEGNGKRSLADRARFLDIARGSTFECAACLDGLVVRKRLDAQSAAEGKALLERVTAMLWRMVNTLQPSKQHATTSPRTSASASASAKPDRGPRSPT
jgi:four helix bundle protein